MEGLYERLMEKAAFNNATPWGQTSANRAMGTANRVFDAAGAGVRGLLGQQAAPGSSGLSQAANRLGQTARTPGMLGAAGGVATPPKVAFWGALAAGARTALPGVARATGSFLGGAGRGLAGMELAAGAGRAAQAGRTTAQIAQGATTAKGIYDTVKPPEPPPAPPGVKPGMKVGSLEARLTRLVRSKIAFGVGDAVNVGSYGAMIGASLLPHEHPLHTLLEGAGLVGLGGTTLAGMLGDPAERKPGLKDLAGLALFGSALYDRYKNHGEAGH